MKKLIWALIIVLAAACKKSEDYKPSFTSAVADTLLNDSISIRAIVVDGDKLWYAGSNGKYGYVPTTEGKGFAGVIARDTVLPEFRAIAKTPSSVFILNAGTPATLYKISKDGRRNELVYTEKGDKVFYDSMHFFDDKNGIAMGDPTENCLSVIITDNGGKTWKKIPCNNLPQSADGEAAFAASNSNIIVKGSHAWIVSGGKKSRVYHSADKGLSWEVFDTPIIQGTAMSGIFSADFYDENIGFAVGGNYDKPDDNHKNKIITTDGGRTWDIVADGAAFGYASCVQFIPGSRSNELVTVGPAGVFYSYDRGSTWKKILDDNKLHTLRFASDKIAYAAGQNKIIRIKLK